MESRKYFRKRWLVALLTGVLTFSQFACDAAGKDSGGGSQSDERSEAITYPPLPKSGGSRDLAEDDAQRGCKLPASERLEYCLQVLAGSKGSTASKRVKKNGNANYALKFFLGQGFSRAQAAGIVGNLMAESGVDPSSDNPAARSGGGGIAQWEGRRWSGDNGLKSYAKKQGKDWDDFDVQLDFIIWELNHTEKGALRQLKGTSSPEAAASAVMKGYERPRPGPTAHEDRRRSFARAVYRG